MSDLARSVNPPELRSDGSREMGAASPDVKAGRGSRPDGLRARSERAGQPGLRTLRSSSKGSHSPETRQGVAPVAAASSLDRTAMERYKPRGTRGAPSAR